MTLLAVDIGGTFTDLMAFDVANQRFYQAKSLTTPHDLAQGIINAINDSQSDNAWGQHARARALETWSPATVVNQYLDVYARAQR